MIQRCGVLENPQITSPEHQIIIDLYPQKMTEDQDRWILITSEKIKVVTVLTINETNILIILITIAVVKVSHRKKDVIIAENRVTSQETVIVSKEANPHSKTWKKTLLIIII